MRKRLTARHVRAEDLSDGVFPGDVGVDRKKNTHDIDEYTDYDFQEGWDLPVKENTWEGEKRDEVGFGIPKTASRFLLAKNSVLMAQCFLGDDAPSAELEKQARDFMKLGNKAVLASLKRWKATEPIPEEETPAEETPAETPEACKAGEECENCEEQVVPQDSNQPAACQADDETPEEAFDEVAADDEAEAVETPEEAPTEVEGDDEAPQLQIDVPPAEEDNASNMFATDGELNQAEADPNLVALLSGEEVESEDEEEAPAAPEACKAGKKVVRAKKQGIKHLAGQPKLASARESFGVKELEGLWSNIKLPGLF